MCERVILVIGDLTIGGAERVTVNLANQFVNDGINVEVLVINKRGCLIDELSDQVTVSTLSANRMPWTAIELARHLRRTRPDVLISFMTAINIMSTFAAELSRVSTQVILTEHNTQTQKEDSRTRRKLFQAKYVYKFADHIVGVSNGVTEDISKWANVSADKITTIYNPVVTNEIINSNYTLPNKEWFNNSAISVVLTAGRHSKQKDHRTLLRAFAELHKEQEHTRLVILGEGELTSEYQDLAVDLGIDNKVSLPGFVDNPYQYMTHADVFALSSRWEGLSLVLIEAMACGTPVVSTDCPNGPSEVLKDGEYGELVPVGDPSSLKNALMRTLQSPTDKMDLQKRANEFTATRAATRYKKLYTNSDGW